MKKLLCATLEANEAKVVDVESAFIRALPGFSIVGLASQSINESKDRIKAALGSIGFKFPAQKITVNLSPSDLKKDGSHFDLCISLLIAFQKEEINFENFFVFGELSLNGEIKSTSTLFSLILSLASKHEKLKVLVPQEIAMQVATIPNVEVYGISTLQESVEFFRDSNKEKYLHVNKHPLFQNALKIGDKLFTCNYDFKLDFKEVKGQVRAKRASLIAAAGMHNILYEGSPGCGKSMSVKRLRYILPPMSVQEVLESAAYRSLDEQKCEFEALRPFRNPHHTSSRPSIFGGGSARARIGEVALAHNGILFFDEFPHFSKQVLESLREPLEDSQVLISRVNSKVKYETKFLFASAQNPCPCGNLFNQTKSCTCSDIEINRYKSKLSAPLLDRIDIYVQMDESFDKTDGLSSSQMYELVLKAFMAQQKREQSELNGKLDEKELSSVCQLGKEEDSILEKAVLKYGLSQRGINKILRVSRTIADLEGSQNIQKSHLLEALSFRQR